MANKIPKFQDLGFGTKITKSGDRLIRHDGSFNIIRKGKVAWDAYQMFIEMSMRRFTVICLSAFILINAFFAILFLLAGIDQLNGIPEGSIGSDFLHALFFSIQTFTTVGYGNINPEGVSANIIASLCAFVGLLTFAIITGLFFARFSRPRSHIAFSKKAILTPHGDLMSFQCRMVNKRNHKITNLNAQLAMTWLEETETETRRFYASLPLERKTIVLFPLNWTLVHPITESSPLYGKSLNDLKRLQAEFLVMTTGFDESYNQVIHSNTSYICSELATNVRFKLMYTSSTDEDEITILNLDDLDELVPLGS